MVGVAPARRKSGRVAAGSVQDIFHDGVDQASSDGHQHQVTACPMPFVARVLGQVTNVLMRDPLAPTMGDRPADDQMGAGWPGRTAAHIMTLLIYLTAQLVPVGCAVLVPLLIDLPMPGGQGMVPGPVARPRVLLTIAVVVPAQHLVTVMVPLLLMVLEAPAVLLGLAWRKGSRRGLGQGAQQCRCGAEADKQVA